jgi:hypothetical protein
MIAVAMSRVDRRQVLAPGCDPFDKFLVLIDRDGGIHQDGIALARNER